MSITAFIIIYIVQVIVGLLIAKLIVKDVHFFMMTLVPFFGGIVLIVIFCVAILCGILQLVEKTNLPRQYEKFRYWIENE